jgi:hypothetical protein
MKYMLLMYANETDVPDTPEEQQAAAPARDALRMQVEAAGVLLSSSGLAPTQLGGYLLLNCQNLDEALRWTEKIPTAKYGSVEVRPLNQWSQQA